MLTQQPFYISTVDISRLQNLLNISFSERTLSDALSEIFQVHLNVLPKLWLIFCFHQQNIQKMNHFWHFTDHNSESKHDN